MELEKPAESKPSKSGNELQTALQSQKISAASDDEIKAVLKYAMLLIGLRLKTIEAIGPEEKAVLLNFIRRHFSGHTLHELRLAFDKAVAGELDVEANPYENFTCEYIGKVMKAYRKWSSAQYQENQMYAEDKSRYMLPASPTDWKELCEEKYQLFLSGQFNCELWPVEMYDELVTSGYMEANIYEDFQREAFTKLTAKIQAEKDQLSGNVEKNMGKLSKLMQDAQEIRVFGEGHLKVINLSKRMSVLFLFHKAKKEGYKNLFVKD